jgi:hypothetical protein
MTPTSLKDTVARWLPWLPWLDSCTVLCTSYGCTVTSAVLPAPHALLFPPHLSHPRIEPSSQSCALTRIIVPANPAEGQITSRSWEICERPQQPCEVVRQHCIGQSSMKSLAGHGQPRDPVTQHYSLDLLSAFAAVDSDGRQTTLAMFRQQPSPPCTSRIHP